MKCTGSALPARQPRHPQTGVGVSLHPGCRAPVNIEAVGHVLEDVGSHAASGRGLALPFGSKV